MAMTPDEFAGLVQRFHATLLDMDRQRIETGGKPPRWNRLVDQLQDLHLRLRETPDGRQAITAMISDENQTVRAWSSTFALFWDRDLARAELERQAADPATLSGFEAQIALREFDAGRLNTAWQPKGGSAR